MIYPVVLLCYKTAVNNRRHISGWLGVWLLLASSASTFGQTTEVKRVHDAAGGRITNATYKSLTAIGQGQSIGVQTNASFRNYAGFLHPLGKADQTIDFPAIGDKLTTDTVGLAATASSGLGVSFDVASGPAMISGGTNLNFTGAGAVSVVASQAGDANWNAAPDVTNTFAVSKASQAALVFAPASPQTYNTTNALSTTGGSGTGTVSYAVLSGPGEIVGADGLKATSGTGEIVVQATKAAEDLYLAQTATATVAVQKAAQTIAFPAIGDKLTTDAVGLAATASSGLGASFDVASGPASISGGTNLTFTGAGSVSIVASQDGDANWNPAPEVTNTFAVSKASQAALGFAPASPQTYNITNLLSTTGGSGSGTVSYAVLSGPGEIVGEDGLKATSGTGEIVVQATKAADDLYLAQTASATVAVQKAAQTIDFPAIGDKLTTDAVGLAATASSGLPVAFDVASGPASIADGTNLTFTGAGSVSIVASQVGDADWNAAPEVTNTFAVSKASQAALAFAPASPQTYNTTNLLSTTGGSGTGTVSYAVLSGPGEIVGADGLKATSGTGEIVVQATKGADALYLAQTATATVTVQKASQTIDFPAIGDKLTTDAVGLTAMASSGLLVAFDVASGPASIAGGTNLTFTGAGSVSIVASQDGDADWNPASEVTNTFAVSKASQAALGFAPASPQTYNTTNALSTTGGSGTGTVSYAVLSGPGEIVGADGLKATSGTGEIAVEATKAADDLYLAQTATATVTVQKASQTINNFLPASGSIFNTASTPGLSATASSGLQVGFAVANGPATIGNGTNLSFTGAGVVRIAASQGGDENWNPAATVTNSYTVNGLTYHVAATGGNDANSGLSWGLAKQTIQSALDLARSGDTVLVSNGIYGAISVAGGVTVRSVNGAAETIIGNLAPGTRGAYLGTNASLAGFSITGAVVNVAGAGIYSESGAQISACILQGNTSTADGGGVYGGNLLNCLLVGNSAANGGAAASASLNYCTVAGNLASVSGGGTKDCTLLNSIVQRNVPDNAGGGAATYTCTLPMMAGIGNITNDPAFANMPFGDFRLTYESACLGAASGGVAVDLDGSPRPQPKIYGGELAYDMGCFEYVPQARFVWTNGNAVAPYESWKDAANDIQTALDISSGGDRIVVEAGTYAPFTVSNAVVLLGYRGVSNTVVDGGGMLRPITITAPATLEGFTVQNGAADDCGGILADNGAILRDIHIANSQATAPGGYGGGLCLYNGSKAENVVVVSNQAQYGAGIYATATSEVHSSTIAWNTSGSGWGGGVYLEDSGTLADSLVEGNSSARGGGVYADDSEIAITTIRGNLAAEYGGGVAIFGGTLRNSWIEDNDAWNGAGIYASDTLGHSCIVAGNIATSRGGGVYLNGISAFYNLTIVTNQATAGGGGVWINGSGRLWNSIVMFNSPSNLAPGMGDIQYSCIAPPPAGTGNFEADPLFVATNDFHLRAGSPCVDAGTNEVWMSDNQDIDGQRRVFPMPPDDHPDPVRDVWIDIGADEAAVDAFSVPFPSNPFWGWNVVVDARLQMQATTNLVIPVLWTNIGTVVTANQATLLIPYTNTERMRHYRLIWER